MWPLSIPSQCSTLSCSWQLPLWIWETVWLWSRMTLRLQIQETCPGKKTTIKKPPRQWQQGKVVEELWWRWWSVWLSIASVSITGLTKKLNLFHNKPLPHWPLYFYAQCNAHFHLNMFRFVIKQEEALWIYLKVNKGKIIAALLSIYFSQALEGIVLEGSPDKKHFLKSAVWFGNRILWPFYLLCRTSRPPLALHCKKRTYE